MILERLQEVFRFWRFGFVPLMLVVLPFSFFGFAIQLGSGSPLTIEGDVAYVNWATLAILALLYPIATGTLIAQMAAIANGQAASFFACLNKSLQHSLFLLLTYMLLGVGVYMGLMLLVLPGLWIYARFSQAPFIVLLENNSPIDALNASFQRTKTQQLPIMFSAVVVGSIILLVTVLSATLLGETLGAENKSADIIHILITAPAGILLDILIFRFYSLTKPVAS